jgi:toxin ParE1/3/4
MSNGKAGPSRYRLTEQAEEDLASVADYTSERFGIAQARKYGAELFRTFDLLVAFPFLGTAQDRVEPGLRRIVHGSHSIYYMAGDSEIVIVALLGPGEDPLRRFVD